MITIYYCAEYIFIADIKIISQLLETEILSSRYITVHKI